MAFEMHSPIFLASFAWTGIWFWLLLGAAVPLGVIVYGFNVSAKREEWLKNVLVPVMTSVVVALVGIGFALESTRRQHADAEADQQTSLMRDLMISQDRRETAHLFALHLNLNIHLHRYMRMIEMPDPKLEKRIRFEEEAIFYFYLKHRAGLVNLRSSKGNLVFRRVWMENIFQQLAIHIVETVLGGLGERDPSVSAEGEAATYRLFAVGAPALSEKNDESPSPKPKDYHVGGYLVLSDFHRLMSDESTTEAQDPDVRQIKSDFELFRERLHNGDKKPPIDPYIDKAKVINAILAMQGLVAYSYQNLLSVWYGLDEHGIPTHAKCLPKKAPKPFLNLMWYDFEPSRPQQERKDMWEQKRQDAWKLILQFRPEEAQAGDCPRAWLSCGDG